MTVLSGGGGGGGSSPQNIYSNYRCFKVVTFNIVRSITIMLHVT